MGWAERNIAYSLIANYLAMNEAREFTYQIMRLYGSEYDTDYSESENLEMFIRWIYSDEREDFADIMTGLIRNYTLNSADLERVDYNLRRLGYTREDGIVVEIPQKDDFYEFLEQCLRDPEAMKAEGGARDGALLALSEGLMEKDEDFVLIDFGCGEGRLLFALSHLPKVIRNHITYIGVDVNEENLNAISEKIKENGFEDKFKSCTVMKIEDFFKAGLKVDYIFMVNVLHEIPLNSLPKIIKHLEDTVKKDGILLIHEMRELIEGEMRFISWDEKDANEIFKNTTFSTYIRPYDSKRGVPLLNVHLKKEVTTSTDLDVIGENLVNMVENKLKRIEDELIEIEDSSDELRIRRFAYLLMLKRNIETQYNKFIGDVGRNSIKMK